MEPEKTVRIPQQKRSIEKKERILAAAYDLFCEKGVEGANTPEIAARAGVSTGSLYSYFKDKREIFLEILKRYDEEFNDLHRAFAVRLDELQDRPMDWMRDFLNALIEKHLQSAAFQRQLKIAYLSDPEIARHTQDQAEQIRAIILKYLSQMQRTMRVKDLDAAAAVIALMINAIVEYTFLYPGAVENERVIDEGLDALQRYLLG